MVVFVIPGKTMRISGSVEFNSIPNTQVSRPSINEATEIHFKTHVCSRTRIYFLIVKTKTCHNYLAHEDRLQQEATMCLLVTLTLVCQGLIG